MIIEPDRKGGIGIQNGGDDGGKGDATFNLGHSRGGLERTFLATPALPDEEDDGEETCNGPETQEKPPVGQRHFTSTNNGPSPTQHFYAAAKRGYTNWWRPLSRSPFLGGQRAQNSS
jgi:hypothetical protein